MIERRFFLPAVGLTVLVTGPVASAVLHVPQDHPTIQAAINVARDGDTVLVAPGVYEVTSPIVFGGRRIGVKSAAGPEATTVRMGTPADGSLGSVFAFVNEELDVTSLEGFTITGGRGSVMPSGAQSALSGGGVFCGPRASPRIAGNIFRGNRAWFGAGIFCGVDSSPLLFENVFIENRAMDGGGGGGIACEADSTVLVEGGTFSRNEGSAGGAVLCSFGSALQIVGARFEENSGQVGGAVFALGERLEVANCEFIGNRAESDGGAVFAQVPSPGRLIMKNCRFDGNQGGSGGGVSIDGFHGPVPGVKAEVSIEDSLFTGNRATKGGGLFVGEESDVMQFRRCRFERNSALIGGGIYCEYDSETIFEGCTVIRNRAEEGGGIWLEDIISARITGAIVVENAENGIGGTGVQIEIDHSTITGNSGTGAPVEFTLIESSVVWDNAGGSLAVPPALDPLRVVARSIIDHRDPWPGVGNSNADPLFGGWPAGPEVHLDAAAPPGGDGTSGRPFRSLEEAVGGYDIGLLPGSPCLGRGKDGSDIGAGTGTALRAGVKSLVIRAAGGTYPLSWASLAHGASLEGAGRGRTVIEGTLFGLRSGRSLAGATVTRGTMGGINVSAFEAPRIEAAGIEGNTGRLGGGIITRKGSSPSFTDCTVLDNAATEGVGSGVFCDESSPVFVRCTFSGNASPFGGTITVSFLGAVTLTSSIVWGNSGPALQTLGALDASFSCIEGSSPGQGNIAVDPLFCGWGAEVAYVDASAAGPGAGTEADPYPALDRAFRGFSVALAPGSPCIGTGKDGADMGASAGTCPTRGPTSLSVRVAPGDYSLSGVALSHAASIEGTSWRETVLHGTVYGLRTGAVLSRVTVTGGLDGGLRLSEGESPDVENIALTRHRAVDKGVISVVKGSPRFTNLIVTGNTALGGPIIFLDRSTPQILNSTFTDNQSAFSVIFCAASSPIIKNCIFWSQSSSLIQFSADFRPVITHTLTGVEQFPGEGNFSLDPRFVAWPNDLRLLPDSPCIDTGTGESAPGTDIDGQARPCWSGVDMGAHEYCGAEPPAGIVRFVRGDANSDSLINISDPVAILTYLFAAGVAPACERSGDMDDNSVVNLADPVFLLNHLFQGGNAPPEPFVSCGVDATADGLTCERSNCAAAPPR